MANSFLDLYFERIGYAGSPRANLETLRDLHRLHLQSIPFENLDVFCLQEVRLDRESLTRKLLARRRGGYCFEQNGIFLMVLAELGFTCRANLARVHYGRPQPGARSHHINFVDLDGRTWMCDVGFGRSGFRVPLPLEIDVETEQLGETYRLHPSAEHGFYLQRRKGASWEPLYTFKIDPALPIDMAAANFYTSKSADHIFMSNVIGTRLTERGRVTLSDHTFKVADLVDGTLESETVTDFGTYVDRLRDLLGVELNEGESELLRNRFGTLKLPES